MFFKKKIDVVKIEESLVHILRANASIQVMIDMLLNPDTKPEAKQYVQWNLDSTRQDIKFEVYNIEKALGK